MRVLITGGTGFVGAHLARRLAAMGAEVHSLSRGGAPPVPLPGIRCHAADIADREGLARLLARVRPRQVFHLAARTRPDAALAPGAEMAAALADAAALLGLIEAAAAAPRRPEIVVRAGSLAEYGAVRVPAREDGPAEPVSPYGAAMLAGTHAARVAAGRAGLRLVTARLALVYGMGQSERFFIPAAVAALRAGRPVTVHRPLARRDLLHIDDAVDGLLRIAAAPPDGSGVINLATGRAETMGAVAALLAAALGARADLVSLGADRTGDVVLGDPSRAARLLGWRARVPLEAGLHGVAAEAPVDVRPGAPRVLEGAR